MDLNTLQVPGIVVPIRPIRHSLVAQNPASGSEPLRYEGEGSGRAIRERTASLFPEIIRLPRLVMLQLSHFGIANQQPKSY